MSRCFLLVLFFVFVSSVLSAQSSKVDCTKLSPPLCAMRISLDKSCHFCFSGCCNSEENKDMTTTSVTTTVKPKETLSCNVCLKIMPFVVEKINAYGCGVAFDAGAIALCEAAGLGPENPLSEVCSAAFVGGCSDLLAHISETEQTPEKLCKIIHICV